MNTLHYITGHVKYSSLTEESIRSMAESDQYELLVELGADIKECNDFELVDELLRIEDKIYSIGFEQDRINKTKRV